MCAGCGSPGQVPGPLTLAKTVYCCENHAKPCVLGGARAPFFQPCVTPCPAHRDACGSELTLHLFSLVIRLSLTVYRCVSPMFYLRMEHPWKSTKAGLNHSRHGVSIPFFLVHRPLGLPAELCMADGCALGYCAHALSHKTHSMHWKPQSEVTKSCSQVGLILSERARCHDNSVVIGLFAMRCNHSLRNCGACFLIHVSGIWFARVAHLYVVWLCSSRLRLRSVAIPEKAARSQRFLQMCIPDRVDLVIPIFSSDMRCTVCVSMLHYLSRQELHIFICCDCALAELHVTMQNRGRTGRDPVQNMKQDIGSKLIGSSD